MTEEALQAARAAVEALPSHLLDRRRHSEEIAANLAPDFDAFAARHAAEAVEQVRGSRWRHKKRGTTYRIVGVARAQAEDSILEDDMVIVYRSEQDGSLWVRANDEFEDGRFERMEGPIIDTTAARIGTRERDAVRREAIEEAAQLVLSAPHSVRRWLADEIRALADKPE